jgi:hypothetical protein
MAVRAFMIGKHATLPKLPAPKSAEIGSQNSLLRRYVGGEKGPLPEGVSELAVREMVKLQLMPEAATLLADWRRGDPKSEALNALLTELRSQPPIRSLIADGKLAGLGRLFGGQPVRNLESRRSLRRAKQISEAYRIHYHHAVPFDRSALRGIWGNCSAKGCREAQHQAEKQLGKIEAPRRGEIQRRIPGAGSPVPNEVTDTADRSESPESS